MLTISTLFRLGSVFATPGALRVMADLGIRAERLLGRHASGDWGNMDAEDRAANDRAVMAGDERVFSSYTLGDSGERIWVITEADRSVTTLLLPSEY